MQTLLVTGTSRGIGLEFVRQYLARGERVFAACRKPDASDALQKLQTAYPKILTLIEQDTGDVTSIQHSFEKVRKHTEHLDLLINNAGMYSTRAGAADEPGSTQELGQLTQGDALAFFRVNSIGPLLVTQQFLPLLQLAKNPKVVSVTSGYGSITQNTSGFPYFYAASKAALNMYTRSLAADLKNDGVAVVVINPGWVRTDMGGKSAPVLPEQSVTGVIRAIDKLTLKQTGHFLDWQGGEIPW